jgi:hypothetical protein
MTLRVRLNLRFLACAAFLFCEVLLFPAYAATSGIDTQTGVTTLPLGVQGVEGMDLVAQPGGSVYVGVGTSVPQAPLDVNGGMRGSNSSIVIGSGCSPEGMLGYDLTNHTSVYCNDGGLWTQLATGSRYYLKSGTSGRAISPSYSLSCNNPTDTLISGGASCAGVPSGTCSAGGAQNSWLNSSYPSSSTTWYAQCGCGTGVVSISIICLM